MIVRVIRKKGGGLRRIFCPDAREKKELRSLLPELNERQLEQLSDSVHGFVPGRSPVTNAMQHRGKRFTTAFDLKDFFDSVHSEMIPSLPEEAGKCFIKNAPRQGLPTSPALANLAAIGMDEEILNLIEPWKVIYTRYADDLTFSYDDPALTRKLRAVIPPLIERHGFSLNRKKTRTMDGCRGRRIITGVAVDEMVHPTRKQRRKLRALAHQSRAREEEAMAAWIQYVKKSNLIFNVACLFCGAKQADLNTLAGHILSQHGDQAVFGRKLRQRAGFVECYCGLSIQEHSSEHICLSRHWSDDWGLESHLLRTLFGSS